MSEIVDFVSNLSCNLTRPTRHALPQWPAIC